jgi:DNA topoisomerase-2
MGSSASVSDLPQIKSGKGSATKATSKAKSSGSGKGRKIDGVAIEQIYTKKTQLEHILLRPDTYIGSIDSNTQEMWVYDKEKDAIVKRNVTTVPGLYKIFDEIIVNAADNKQRDGSMSKLMVTIDTEKGSISVWNNGRGIPIAVHAEHGIYVPELIFGNLLTGSNFDDDQKKTTGGRNGYGAKLANIFSKEFVVETADSEAGQRYKQTFRDNMGQKGEPQLTPYSGEDFTCITFKPDWGRFKMDGLDSDTLSLLQKRVYDVAGCMAGFPGKKVKVYLNGERLAVASFRDYVQLYQGLSEPVAFERLNDQWEIGVGGSDGHFEQISFVNSICTTKGGAHANYIADQVTGHLISSVKKKCKGQEVKAHDIKRHLCVYVNALIENPAFDSQTKETLTTKSSAFGGKHVQISSSTLKALEKSDIIESVLSWAKFQARKGLVKIDGKKTQKVKGIAKLDDANFAGTARSKDCTLILTEGDSAKTLAVSGLGVVGRDYFGVFPLKGKLLNVRESATAVVQKNDEIANIVKIMGLKFGAEYDDTKSLRYGHLMIMTDQDHDGSHIKGLLINFIHHFWPSLLKVDGFLREFITPIVKCSRAGREKVFFTIPEYEDWRQANSDGKGWTIKYYKGLGTSTAKEAKEYFAKIDTHQLDFEWQDDARDNDLIDMAFSKKRVEDRKDWLRSHKAGTFVDYSVDAMDYDSFVNRELILFSIEDNKRSIPCMVDGFKPSQRKVLFSCFKRKLKNEIKVAQLAGYVSEHSAYHHGEASLTQTIIGMAQNFCGSNNINLLCPSGQFGTRLMGGKDSASPRYIFTRLEKIARAVFHPDDDAILSYLDDDGLSIEPTFYMPVIPMVLVNGSDGIGTGYSSTVPQYSPRDIIENVRRRLRGQDMIEMQPWYRGFVGDITAKGGRQTGSYTTEGSIQRTSDDTVEIYELPVKRWTQDYKTFLEGLLPGAAEEKAKEKKGAKGPAKKKKGDAEDGEEKPSKAVRCVKDFKENHTDTTVHFTITMSAQDLDAIEREPGGLAKFFRLESSMATSNMQLFDADGIISRYESPYRLMEEFYDLRLEYYGRRKANLLCSLQKDWSKLDNKVRFLLAVISGSIKVNNRKKSELLAQLKAEGYDTFAPEGRKGTKAKAKVAGGVDDGGDDSDTSDSESASGDDTKGSQSELVRGYDYLLSLKLWSLTKERVVQLESELEAKTREVDALKATSLEQLWLRDLDAIEVALNDCDADMAAEAALQEKQRQAAGRGGGGKGRKKKSKNDEDLSDFEESGGRSKSSKASKGPKSVAPPAPAAHSRSTELQALSGKTVSAAFAEAERAGRVLRDVDRLGAADADDSSSRRPSRSLLEAGDINADLEEDEDGDAVVADVKPVVQKKPKAPKKEKAEGGGGATLSLMERMKLKYATNFEPVGVPAKKAAPKPKSRVSSKAPVESDSDAESEVAESDEEFRESSATANKRKLGQLKPSAAAAPAKARKVVKKTKKVDSDGDDDDDDLSVAPAPKKATAVKSAAAPKPKKAAAAPKPKPKKMALSSDDEDEEEDDDDDMSAVRSSSREPRRGGRAKSVNYAQFAGADSDEDDEEEASDAGGPSSDEDEFDD